MIAFISEVIEPMSIFHESETGLLVYKILLSYWEWTPEDDVRPLIFLMSE
jgi:hypothetical protein